MISADHVGPLELLVIQPTPFCNLDCSYCYLPDRLNKRKITLETLEKTLNWVFSSGLVRQPVHIAVACRRTDGSAGVVLRAGHACAGAVQRQRVRGHAVLADQRHLGERSMVRLHPPAQRPDRGQRRWSRFPERPSSCDPERRRHARARVARHADAARPRDFFRRHHGADRPTSLDYPDELFDFYVEHGVTSVAFNVEEIEGPHVTSSLSGSGIGAALPPLLFPLHGPRARGRPADAGARIRDRPQLHRLPAAARYADTGVQAVRHPQRGLRGQLLDLFARAAGPQQSAASAASRWATSHRTRWNRCWRCRGSLLSTTRSAAAWSCATKPAATSRSAAAARPATSTSRTATSPRRRRCPVACTRRRPSMSRSTSLNESRPVT